MSEVQAEMEAPVAVTKAKTKAKEGTGNLILDIAAKVENLTKAKALAEADRLFTQIETDYFEMGGILNVILKQSWFEGYESFGAFVYEKYGFQERKARYLISIYENLVEKQIPWDKVKGLGWTKLKDLAPILSLDNVDEWAAKAALMSVIELQAAIKATMAPEGEEGKESTTITSDVETLKFKLKGDQIATVKSALNKAKAELGTEYDTVALENICAGYLSGAVGTSQPLAQVLKEAGWEQVLMTFGEVFPTVNITVE